MVKIAIYICCPACIDDGFYTQKVYWQHSQCKTGKLYLTEFANISCSGCNYESHISNWSFKCPDGRHSFIIPTTAGFTQALSVSSQMTSEGGQRWLISILEKIQ